MRPKTILIHGCAAKGLTRADELDTLLAALENLFILDSEGTREPMRLTHHE